MGTLLDDDEEWTKRKVLAWNAISKLSKIWKNCNIKIRSKVLIFKTYVESILLYKCGVWATNKTSEKTYDSFQRRLLRWILNIKYPKTKIYTRQLNKWNYQKPSLIDEKRYLDTR